MGLINFNELPTQNTNKKPDPGCYKAVIKTTYVGPKEGKTEYLQVGLKLTTFEGVAGGLVTDFLRTDATYEFLKYKLARFISAIGLPLTGSMELKDIAKIADGKTVGVDINNRKDRPGEVQVDPFAAEVYYTEPELEERWKNIHPDVYKAATTQDDIAAMNDKTASEISDGDTSFCDAVDTGEPVVAPDNSEY